MTDLELVRLCAVAMGIKREIDEGEQVYRMEDKYRRLHWFDPIHDDAQAMALVKRFRLNISAQPKEWDVDAFTIGGNEQNFCTDADLNRAICECVAKMELARQK